MARPFPSGPGPIPHVGARLSCLEPR
jgi:hypothetical protein